MTKATEQDSLLRDMFSSVKSIAVEMSKARMIFLIVGVFVFSFFFYKKLTTPVEYISRSSFMLNESGGDNTGISAILGQFGIATPGQSVSLQKIIEIAKTRIISEKVFLAKETVNGKEDFLGNHIIQVLDRHNGWSDNGLINSSDPLKTFRFTQSELSKFSDIENMALKKLHSIFLKKLETSFNEKTGIMELSTIYADQDLSYVLGNKLFDELSQFYVKKTTERQQETYNKLKAKVDSIRNLMNRKDYTLANLKDGFRNTWTFEDVVPQAQTDRDVRMLSLVYSEAIKNLEIASFTLQNQTPFIQALDLPIKPLEKRRISWSLTILKSLGLTFLLAGLYILLRKLIRENS